MKKGFSLVEMLAVLVLISLLAIMILPAINENSRKGEENNAKNNVINYISAVETYLKVSALDKNKVELPYNQTYNVSEPTVIDKVPYQPLNNLVEINGDYPTSGKITIDDNYTVTSADIVVGGYNIIYNNNDKIVSINPA